MNKYFILNFLSFQSLNTINFLQGFRRLCGIHGAYDLYSLESSSTHAGYTISYTYKELDDYYPESIFILVKENPQDILTHLMYGYYSQLYDDKVLLDFENFFKINFNNFNENDIANLSNRYYFEVEDFFKENLLIIDLSQTENSFYSFIKSELFLPFYYKFEETEQFKNISLDVQTDSLFIDPVKLLQNFNGCKDYFIKTSPFFDVPISYPMNSVMGSYINVIPGEQKSLTYLNILLTSLTKNEI
jgi:hypothetical protein